MGNWGTEEGSEGGGRKRFKKASALIGPTKKGLISVARREKIEVLSSYLSIYLSVVVLRV